MHVREHCLSKRRHRAFESGSGDRPEDAPVIGPEHVRDGAGSIPPFVGWKERGETKTPPAYADGAFADGVTNDYVEGDPSSGRRTLESASRIDRQKRTASSPFFHER